MSNTQLVSSPDILSMLNPAGRGKIRAVKINESNMQALLASDSAKLSLNGRMMNLARRSNVFLRAKRLFISKTVKAYGWPRV